MVLETVYIVRKKKGTKHQMTKKYRINGIIANDKTATVGTQ